MRWACSPTRSAAKPNAAEKALEALAEATGGETFFPRDVSEVERIANQVAQRYPQPVHHRVHTLEPSHGRRSGKSR